MANTRRRSTEQEQARYGYMKTQEVADLIGVSRTHVIELVRGGHLAAVDVALGSRPEFRIARESLDAFLQGRAVA